MALAKFDKKLAAILIEHGVLEAGAAEEHLSKAQQSGRALSEHLVGEKLISERGVIAVVAREMGLPPIDLERLSLAPELLALLPQEMAEYYEVIPVAKARTTLTLAMSNPYDVLTLDAIKVLTGCDVQPVISTEGAIRRTLGRAYGTEEIVQEEKADGPGEPDLDIQALIDQEIPEEEMELTSGKQPEEDMDIAQAIAAGNDAPVVKLVNMIIYQAVNEHVSDIHIEPFEHHTRVRYRLDGACYESLTPPRRMHGAIVSRIKVMCGMDIAERRVPQDAKFQLRAKGRQVDFRVSTLPMVHGEKVVIRILDSSNLSLSLESLGFEEKCLTDFSYAIRQPYGMILVTGPTGSGKSTTLYSSVKEVISVEENISTVEDPVEYQLEGVNQVPVNEKQGLTFAAALRSLLRQDPDTIMIGEIRDLETVEIAVKAALTGHRVFSTLHTNDAPSTVTRMIDMGVDPFMVASSVLLVAAQRLGRKVCESCRQPVDVPHDRLLEEGFTEEEVANLPQLYKADGCETCSGKGYKGRFALLETMPMAEELRRVVIEGGSAMDIRKAALEQGMITLRRAGILNILRGRTTIEDVLRITLRD